MAKVRLVLKKSARKTFKKLKTSAESVPNNDPFDLIMDEFLSTSYEPTNNTHNVNPTSPQKVKKTRKLGRKEKKLLKELQGRMVKDAQVKKCQGFIYDASKNILLMPEPESRYVMVKGKFKKVKSSKLIKKEHRDPNPAHVLIDCGGQTYQKVSFKLYKSLCKIQYMTLRIKMIILEDGDDQPYVALDTVYAISSLNQLFSILNRRDGLIEGLRIYHAGQGWYNRVTTTETVKILYKKKTVEITSLGKFLKHYKIYS